MIFFRNPMKSCDLLPLNKGVTAEEASAFSDKGGSLGFSHARNSPPQLTRLNIEGKADGGNGIVRGLWGLAQPSRVRSAVSSSGRRNRRPPKIRRSAPATAQARHRGELYARFHEFEPQSLNGRDSSLPATRYQLKARRYSKVTCQAKSRSFV